MVMMVSSVPEVGVSVGEPKVGDEGERVMSFFQHLLIPLYIVSHSHLPCREMLSLICMYMSI